VTIEGNAMSNCTFCDETRDDLTISSDGHTHICGDCYAIAEVAQ